MNTQQQAYIEGFVKRASEYGFNYNEAVELFKQSDMSQFGQPLGEGIAKIKANLKQVRDTPGFVQNEINKAVAQEVANSKDTFNNIRHGIESGVFRVEHPITSDYPVLGDAADFFINHDINPMHAAAGIGGAGLLGGGYLMHKLLQKKKTPEIAKQADEYVATEPTFAQKAAIKPKPVVPVKPTPTRPVPPKSKVPNYPGEADANDVAGYR